jgi:APA family basic amino acid/polyamine antiporter
VANGGLAYVQGAHFVPFNASEQSAGTAVTACVALTLWAFLGLETATIPAGSIARPGVTIPRATLLGTSLTAVVYIMGTVAVMGILPPARLAISSAPFADAAREIWGGWAAYAVAAGAAVSCFGALNGWILVQGQLPLAVARDRLFPAAFGRLSARGTPVAGLVLSSLLATGLVAMNYTRSLVEQFTFIILLATLTALVPYVFCTMAILITLGRSQAAIAVPAFLYALWAVAGAGRDVVYWGFLLLLAGIPVYAWMARQTRGGEMPPPESTP